MVARIEDEAERRATFERSKRALIKQAMELSILCDCDIQLFIFSAKAGAAVDGAARSTTTQFSSGDPEVLQAHLREHPAPPSECFSNNDYWSAYAEVAAVHVLELHLVGRDATCSTRGPVLARTRDNGTP
jgi:hypothetical protein